MVVIGADDGNPPLKKARQNCDADLHVGDLEIPDTLAEDALIPFPTHYETHYGKRNDVLFYDRIQALILGRCGWELDDEKIEKWAELIPLKEVIDVDLALSSASDKIDPDTGEVVVVGKMHSVATGAADVAADPERLAAADVAQPNASSNETLNLANLARTLAYNVINFSFFPNKGDKPWFIDTWEGEMEALQKGQTTIGEDDESFAIVSCMKRYENRIVKKTHDNFKDPNAAGLCWADYRFLFSLKLDDMEKIFEPSANAGKLAMLTQRLECLRSLGRMYETFEKHRGFIIQNVSELERSLGSKLCGISWGEEDHISALQLFILVLVMKTESTSNVPSGEMSKPEPKELFTFGDCIEENLRKILQSSCPAGQHRSLNFSAPSSNSTALPLSRCAISCRVFVPVLAALCPAFRDLCYHTDVSYNESANAPTPDSLVYTEFAKRPQLCAAMITADKSLNLVHQEDLSAFADYRLPQLCMSKGIFRNCDVRNTEDGSDAISNKAVTCDAATKKCDDVIPIATARTMMVNNTFVERGSRVEACLRGGCLCAAEKLKQLLNRTHKTDKVRTCDVDYYLWRTAVDMDKRGELIPFHKCRTFCY